MAIVYSRIVTIGFGFGEKRYSKSWLWAIVDLKGSVAIVYSRIVTIGVWLWRETL